MKISHTRAMINAILTGKLDDVAKTPDPFFGVEVPQSCPDVPAEVLNPRNTWKDKAAYDATAADLTRRFANNFKQFEDKVDAKVKAAAIKPAS